MSPPCASLYASLSPWCAEADPLGRNQTLPLALQQLVESLQLLHQNESDLTSSAALPACHRAQACSWLQSRWEFALHRPLSPARGKMLQLNPDWQRELAGQGLSQASHFEILIDSIKIL